MLNILLQYLGGIWPPIYCQYLGGGGNISAISISRDTEIGGFDGFGGFAFGGFGGFGGFGEGSGRTTRPWEGSPCAAAHHVAASFASLDGG